MAPELSPAFAARGHSVGEGETSSEPKEKKNSLSLTKERKYSGSKFPSCGPVVLHKSGMCLWMGMAHNSRQADIKSVCAETCPRTVMDYLALIPLPARPGLAQPTDPNCLECDKIAGACQGCWEARFISLHADG